MFRKDEVKSISEVGEVKKSASRDHPILTKKILDQLQKQLAAKTNLIQSRHYQHLSDKYVDDIDFNSIETEDIEKCLQGLKQGIRIVDYDKDFCKRLPSHISKEEIIKKFQEKLKVEGKEQPYSYVELIDFNDLSIHLEKWPFLYDMLTQEIAAQGDAYITNLKIDFLCVVCTENTKPGHWIKRASEINSQMAYIPVKKASSSYSNTKEIFEEHLKETKLLPETSSLFRYHRCEGERQPYVIVFCEKSLGFTPNYFKDLMQQSSAEKKIITSERERIGFYSPFRSKKNIAQNEVIAKFNAIKNRIFSNHERARLESYLVYRLNNILSDIKPGHTALQILKDISFPDLEVIFVQCDYDLSETENKTINEYATSIKEIFSKNPEKVSISIINELIEDAIQYYKTQQELTNWDLSHNNKEMKKKIKTIFLKLHVIGIDIAPSLFDNSDLLSEKIQKMKSKLGELGSLIEKGIGNFLGQIASEIKPEIERPSSELKR